jgi:hypothetical protein
MAEHRTDSAGTESATGTALAAPAPEDITDVLTPAAGTAAGTVTATGGTTTAVPAVTAAGDTDTDTIKPDNWYRG